MHIVSTLACHNLLQMERILDMSVEDTLSYLQYIDAKAKAESAQMKFEQELRKHKK